MNVTKTLADFYTFRKVFENVEKKNKDIFIQTFKKMELEEN